MPNTKTSDETAAGTLDGTELVRIVQGGNNRRTTAQLIAERGSRPLVATRIASGSASLEWTGLDALGFDYFELIFANLIPSNVGDSLYGFFGTGATPTWQTANYQYAASIQGSSGGYLAVALESQSQISLFDAISNTLGLSGRYTFFPGSAQIFGQATGKSSADSHYYQMMAQGTYTGGTALTALKLQMSTGNIASGKASLYGIRS